MKINVSILGWTDMCCGCNKKIKSTDKVYMISDITGVTGSIHLCESCINDIADSKEKNVDTKIYQDFNDFLSK